ncbi:UDP-N-acetylmuramate dehydrogenase [bacterium]|jgi:UDP-N-acetylmuramate dehydrogenase|nr:UDP-N-acetylmuramate dehydrogenase [bacterium]
MKEWFEKNSAGFSGTLGFDEPLAASTYYRIGGPAAVLAAPKSQEDLEWLSKGIRETGIPFFLLGLGSNTLVSDSGFDGLVVKMTKLDTSMTPDGGLLRTGASVAISSLLRKASTEGWGGLEFLSGVPGSVGGAVFMNAGTHLGETAKALLRVRVLDLKTGIFSELDRPQLKYEYRKNHFLEAGHLVLGADWRIEMKDPEQVKKVIDETLARRKASQPIEFPSCGSVFKNPKSSGMHAWQVIEKIGLRGHQIGQAQFAEKHCNFIINLGKATAADVVGLIRLAKSKAQSELGVTLEEEVRYLGKFE